MELFLVRHAEAETPRIAPGDPNRLELIDQYGSGDYDGSLTDRGRQQAEEVGRFLRDRGVRLVYASPTPRARQTAEIAAQQAGAEVSLLPEFREIRIGYLRPNAHPSIARRMEAALAVNDVYARLTGRQLFFPVALYFVQLYVSSWLSGRTERAEQPRSVRDRLEKGLERVTEELRATGCDRAAVITHGYAIYYVANHIVAPHRRVWSILRRPFVRNVSVTHLVWTGNRWQLESYAEPVGQEQTFGIAGG